MDKTVTEIYYSTLDLYPQQTAEHNQLHRFYDNLRQGVLSTTKCGQCGHVPWPPRLICPECTSDDLQWADLPKVGTVDVFTVSYAGHPPQFGSPIILAMVTLSGGPTVLSRLVETAIEDVEDGCEVELVVLPVDRDRVTYAFRTVGRGK